MEMLMKEVFIALLAGIVSGLLSPLILSVLQHKIIWRRQKRFEVKFGVFTDAVKALSAYGSDAMNPEIQENKKSHKGMVRKTALRPETDQMLDNSRSIVKAFYSEETYHAFNKALRTEVSFEKVPNEEYEENRISAIIKMASELGIRE
jgi:hypothetical protein